MKRRTTIEIEEKLLERAKKALGQETVRATVEQALRLATESAEVTQQAVAQGQLAFLSQLGQLADLEILGSDDMWR